MKLWETLLHPDQEELELGDRVLVSKAANILQVGEFQLLQLAYHDWFTRDLPPAMVDQLFAAYMLRNEVPHWARHYARKILVKADHGQVNDNEAAYHAYDHEYRTHTPGGVRQFIRAVAILTLLIGGSIILANFAAGPGAGMFPPYLDTEDLKVRQSSSFGRADSISFIYSGEKNQPRMGGAVGPGGVLQGR